MLWLPSPIRGTPRLPLRFIPAMFLRMETNTQPLWADTPGSAYHAARREGKVLYEAA
jgi:hypothetical protein